MTLTHPPPAGLHFNPCRFSPLRALSGLAYQAPARVWGPGRSAMHGRVRVCVFVCMRAGIRVKCVYWLGILLQHLHIPHPRGGLPLLSWRRWEKWEIIKG